MQRGTTGFTYLFENLQTHVVEQLAWDDGLKSWISPCGKVVDQRVEIWLKQRSQQELLKPHPSLEFFTMHFLRKPWTHTPPHVKRLLPKEIDLDWLQHVLNYSFSNTMLLAEALAHSSCLDAVTPCNDRLTFLGTHVMEALVASLLMEERLGYAESHASPWKPKTYDPTTIEPRAHDRTIDSWKEVNSWISACCNHLAYARASVHLLLHKRGLRLDSEPLQQGMSEFEQLLQRLDLYHKDNPWPFIIKHGAPRALGDAFLAVVGSVYMDSGWRSTKHALRPVLEAHFAFCKPLAMTLHRVSQRPDVFPVTELTNPLQDSFLEFKRDAAMNHTLWDNALDSVSSSLEKESQLMFSDVNVCTDRDVRLMDGTERNIVGGCSEKVAELTVILADTLPDMKTLPQMLADDSDSEGEAGVATADQAIHCSCNKWLNSERQYQDHKFGKKHAKNIKSMKAAGLNANGKGNDTSQHVQAPPPGGRSDSSTNPFEAQVNQWPAEMMMHPQMYNCPYSYPAMYPWDQGVSPQPGMNYHHPQNQQVVYHAYQAALVAAEQEQWPATEECQPCIPPR